MKIRNVLLTNFLVLFCSLWVFAQDKAPENWFNLDEKKDGIRGVSTERAYKELLKDKKPQKVIIVGVIDSGIDIKHEDLQTKLWTNAKEKPQNDNDDDKNGYVDDVNGWNFIGGRDGKNISRDSYEVTREFARLSKKYKDKSEADFKGAESEEYQNYLKVKEKFEKKAAEAKENYDGFKGFYYIYSEQIKVLKKHLKKGENEYLTQKEVEAVSDGGKEVQEAKKSYLRVVNFGLEEESMKEYYEQLEGMVKYGYNPEYDPRQEIVNDKYENVNEKGYGNSDVIGSDAKHGTHVAGIIAANRNNEKGIKGIADNVLVIPVRAVPDGDERDKDIANAIRYAVDNGANIINMSFGKSLSPQKTFVDEAVRYAESKNVLLIHAAGNEAKDLEVEANYPNRQYNDNRKEASNWIEVGASSWGDEDNFVGSFSNYGKTKVDVFAPGVDIYSTIPNQRYKAESGTSMAAPVTSGVAALLMSYYPKFTAKEVKDIILKSAVTYPNKKINKPKEGDPQQGKTYTTLSELCVTGGIVNAYQALKLAEELSKKKK